MNFLKTLTIVLLSFLFAFSVQADDKVKVGFIYVGLVVGFMVGLICTIKVDY